MPIRAKVESESRAQILEIAKQQKNERKAKNCSGHTITKRQKDI